MTVQELIDALSKVENKDLPVCFLSHANEDSIPVAQAEVIRTWVRVGYFNQEQQLHVLLS